MKPMRRLLPYLTVLMLAVGGPLTLLLLSPTVLWADPITSSIPLSFEPGAITTDSANNLVYVVDQGNRQIRVIDGVTGDLLPNSFPVLPDFDVSSIAVDGARHRLFVDYYCSGCKAYVQVFNIDTQREIMRIDGSYGAGGMAINPDNGRVYVAMFHEVWVLYPWGPVDYYLGNRIIGLDDKAGDVTYDRLHQRLYVSIHTASEVAVVDTNTETLICHVPVLAGNPTTIAVNPNNRHVYVGQNLGNRISVVDGTTNTALTNITLADGPVAVGVDPITARVFVGMRDAASVGIIDGNTDTVLFPLIPIYGKPSGIAVNTAEHCAYVGVRDFDEGQHQHQSLFKVCDVAAPVTTPTGLTAMPISSSRIVLSWTDRSENETGFKIERKTGDCASTNAWVQIATKGANVSTYTSTGLKANKTYAYRIRAYNDAGNSEYSACVSAKTGLAGTPVAAAWLTATSASASKISLKWTDNSDDETDFKIYRKRDSDPWTLLITADMNVKKYDDTSAIGKSATSSYSYYVTACNGAGCSPPTSTAIVPFKPTAPKATPSAGKINLNWTDKSGNESGFQVYRKDGNCASNSVWELISTTAENVHAYSDTDLTSGAVHSYKVRASTRSAAPPYASGYSTYTGCVSATVP